MDPMRCGYVVPAWLSNGVEPDRDEHWSIGESVAPGGLLGQMPLERSHHDLLGHT